MAQLIVGRHVAPAGIATTAGSIGVLHRQIASVLNGHRCVKGVLNIATYDPAGRVYRGRIQALRGCAGRGATAAIAHTAGLYELEAAEGPPANPASESVRVAFQIAADLRRAACRNPGQVRRRCSPSLSSARGNAGLLPLLICPSAAIR